MSLMSLMFHAKTPYQLMGKTGGGVGALILRSTGAIRLLIISENRQGMDRDPHVLPMIEYQQYYRRYLSNTTTPEIDQDLNSHSPSPHNGNEWTKTRNTADVSNTCDRCDISDKRYKRHRSSPPPPNIEALTHKSNE